MVADASSAEGLLTLPRGGGALSGIGESFAPDPHTGAGNLTVPLALPNGRNGFQPGLALIYSTGQGDDAFGLGWSLNIPGISRKTTKGVPRYDDSDDYVLSQADELVPVEHTPAQTRYRPRTERNFAAVIHHHTAGRDEWEVRTTDGLVSHFGRGLVSPTNPGQVFDWRLVLTQDPFGNKIEYDYEHDVGTSGPHQWDRPYLRRISYVHYGPTEQPLVTVEFEYQPRPDERSYYRSGFEIRNRKRCARINVFTHADESRLARSYEFIYRDEPCSLLTQIRPVGHASDFDGDTREVLPCLELGYQPFDTERRKLIAMHGPQLPTRSLAEPGIELLDIFGNGLPSLVEFGPLIRYWRNLGGGEFDAPRYMADAPAGVDLNQPTVGFLDADGDGQVDLVVSDDRMSGYFPMRPGGGWSATSFRRYRQGPSFALRDPNVRLIDLDGDGVTDALRSGARFECFFNDPHEGWTRSRVVERQALDLFPDVDFADPRVKWADMTGDGLQSIVLVSDGNIEYWPNLGHGNWGARIHMAESPRLPWGYNPRRVLLGDVDGDGAADLLYVDDGSVTLWRNRGSDRWSAPVTITGTPRVTDTDDVRMADILGTGVEGVLWSGTADDPQTLRMFFLDFTGSRKPYLMNTIDNHMGTITRVEYATSAQFYASDERRADTRWDTTLPFPVHVTAKVEVADYFSGNRLATTYRYHYGAWDGDEREFRGFGMVEQINAETLDHPPTDPLAYSPPTLTRTWFHQGSLRDDVGHWREPDRSSRYWPEDPRQLPQTRTFGDVANRRDALRALRGTTLRTEVYALDGSPRADRPYSVTESSCALVEVVTPTATTRGVYYPHQWAERATQWERGNDPMTRYTFVSYFDADGVLDPFGRILALTEIACPRGWRRLGDRPTQNYLGTRVCLRYAEPLEPDGFLHNRVARSSSFELLRTGGHTVLEIAARPDNSPDFGLSGQSLTYYDGEPFRGLPLGQTGRFGAVVRAANLVLTPELVDSIYGAAVPPYLSPTLPPAWTADYPAEFRSLLPARAGYIFRSGSADPFDPAGYFAEDTRHRYDFQSGLPARGLLMETHSPVFDAAVNPSGRRVVVDYDPYDLLAVRITDGAGLSTSARHDYRILQPAEMTDPNGNTSRFTYSPLGFLTSISVTGKSPGEGDTTRPSVRMEYGFTAFENSPADARQPVFARTVRQIHHDTELDVALPERDATISTVEYSDGFGRLLQIRTQTEPLRFGDPVFGGGDTVLPIAQGADAGTDVAGSLGDPLVEHVVVTGAQIYNNKGMVIEKYEPFYGEGWAYRPARDETKGASIRMVYDPRGRTFRTLTPDGAETRVVYGIPELTDPDRFEPSPWESYEYDANDNAGRTHAAESIGYAHHWDTPTSTAIDALGRVVLRVERNRGAPAHPGDPPPAIREITTRIAYDIRHNIIGVTDTAGRVVSTARYDLTNSQLRTESIDSGATTSAFNAAGEPIEARDARGTRELTGIDGLGRIVRLWASDGEGRPLTLRETIEYGDGGKPDQPTAERAAARSSNRLGRPARCHDASGMLVLDSFDFAGNLVQTTRRVLSDDYLLSAFNPPPPGWAVRLEAVDWSSATDNELNVLDPQTYLVKWEYDALNRIKGHTLPKGVDGLARRLRATYSVAGQLEKLELQRLTAAGGVAATETVVEHTAYNARGQRVLIARGNGVMTRYAYDPATLELKRMRSERYSLTAQHTFRPQGQPLQDLAYDYDIVGALVATHDRTPGCGIPGQPGGPDRLDRQFRYDAIYQLISATGRESITQPDPPWNAGPSGADPTRVRAYTESYDHDAVGCMRTLRHNAGVNGFTREHVLVDGTNRLGALKIGTTTYNYEYDAGGNMLSETSSRHFDWDHTNRLHGYRTQTSGAEPSVYAHYLYNIAGHRVKKLVRKAGGQIETTVCINGIYEHHRVRRPGTMTENTMLLLCDSDRRLATVRIGPALLGDPAPAVTFTLDDHLHSAAVIIGGTAIATARDPVDREEFTPFGETSFGSYARKRYRFGGKERDEESGLYQQGARYYLPWACRFASCDPLGIRDGVNVYGYVRNSPLVLSDPDGRQADSSEILPGDRDPVSSPGSTTVGDIVGMQVAAEPNYTPYTPDPKPIASLEDGGVLWDRAPPEVPQYDFAPKPKPEQVEPSTPCFSDYTPAPGVPVGDCSGPVAVAEVALTARFPAFGAWLMMAQAKDDRDPHLVVGALTFAAGLPKSGSIDVTQRSMSMIPPGFNPVPKKKLDLWVRYLTKRGVRFEIGTQEAYQVLGNSAGTFTARWNPITNRWSNMTIYLRSYPDASVFYEECLHALDAIKGRPTQITAGGVLVDGFEYRAKDTILNSPTRFDPEELQDVADQLQSVIDGTYARSTLLRR